MVRCTIDAIQDIKKSQRFCVCKCDFLLIYGRFDFTTKRDKPFGI